MVQDTWNPSQYLKFQKERDKPFLDLMKLVNANPKMNIVDLGCGTGHLTQILHTNLKAKNTLGIDSSEAMLKEASAIKAPGLEFQLGDIEKFHPKMRYNLIFSNAALQWIPNHEKVIEDMLGYLLPEGQIAIQVPSNFESPTHVIAKEIAKEEPFVKKLKGGREPSVLPIEAYAEMFYRMGAKEQNVKMQVYPYVLESTDSAIEWVKGTLFTYYQSRLPADQYQEFLRRYSEKVHKFFGEKKPFFYPFKRILIWATF